MRMTYFPLALATFLAASLASPASAQWHGGGGHGGGMHGGGGGWHGGGGGWHGGHGGWHGGGWHGGGGGWRRGGGWVGPAIGLGILGGALAGGAYYGYQPYYAPAYRCPPGYYFASDGQCWPY